MGFFNQVETESRVAKTIPQCGACGLSKTCNSPKQVIQGDGRRGVLVVSETPGPQEDRNGVLLRSESGDLLEQGLAKYGLDLYRDCWITAAVLCHPPSNRLPNAKELDSCLPNVLNTIKELDPKVIICAGKYAIRQVVGQLWRNSIGDHRRWIGHLIPSIDWNAWVCPMEHPSWFLDKANKGEVDGVLWKRNLEKVCDLEGRPWNKVPDLKARIRLVTSGDDAVEHIERYMDADFISFDYESDRLKPDHPDATLVSCSVSDGKTAVAYPWCGGAIEATRQLLHSPVPKVAWNIKHEQRWTRRAFGKGVRNWHWDGMIAAHIEDNSPGVTGLKFQSLVQLGISVYDTKVGPMLEAESGNQPNRIRHVPLNDLLLYNGMDALCTARLTKYQEKRFK